MTAHDAVMTNGRLAAGETVLVQAASTGVGIIAVQIAKLRGAALIMGTSTSPAKIERLKALGMDQGVDGKHKDFAKQVLELTKEHGADLVIDHVSRRPGREHALPGAVDGAITGGMALYLLVQTGKQIRAFFGLRKSDPPPP